MQFLVGVDGLQLLGWWQFAIADGAVRVLAAIVAGVVSALLMDTCRMLMSV